MPEDYELIHIDAYHGTYVSNLTSILAHGLAESEGDEHWLGNGIYFFTEGSSGNDPVTDVREWAIAEFSAASAGTERQFAIIKYAISVNDDAFLDLTKREGMEVFNYLRSKYLEKIKQSGYQVTNGPKHRDGELLNDAFSNLIVIACVVKGDFFFKFTQERMAGIDFRIPNTTILAVRLEEGLVELGQPEVISQQYF